MKIFNRVLFIILIFSCSGCDTKTDKTESKSDSSITEIKAIQSINTIPKPGDEIVGEFYDAIFEDNTVLALQMLESTFPADYEPVNKIKPIEAAIWQNNFVLVKKLVEKGAKINDENFFAVDVASEYGRLEILKYLLANKAIISDQAFTKAKTYECSKFLLENGGNVEAADPRLRFFLQAVLKNDMSSIKLLKINKQEINYSNCQGETALIIAIKEENNNLVKYLIDLGADINTPETFDCGDEIYIGEKPIEIARKTRNAEIVKLLSATGSGEN